MMRKHIGFLLLVMLTAMLGGCVLAKTPASDTVYMSYGATQKFSIVVIGNHTYLWTLDGQPLACTGKSCDYTALAGGHMLVVRASYGDKWDTETWYIVANSPPTASAGPNQTVGEGLPVTLDASNSSDPDDDITSYFWEQIDGPAVTLSDVSAEKPTFTSPVVPVGGASLTFKVTVTDATGLTDSATTIVNVTWANDPPTADAGLDQTVDEGVLVTLDGSGSTDPDDGIASYAWEQVAGPLPFVTIIGANTANPTFTTPTVGIGGEALVFKLTVTDNGGLKSTDTVIVNVTWSNQPPTADAGLDQTLAEGTVVTLDGSASVDPDDGIASYAWVQTGGAAVTLSDPTAVNPTFTTPDVGMAGDVLTFELTVTDHGGLQTTDSVSITVVWVNAPPVAEAGPNQNVAKGSVVTLNGMASTDPDDGIVSYLWQQTNGPAVSLIDANTSTASFTTNVPVGSVLSFKLTVTDAGGLTSTDTCTVSVLAAPIFTQISGGFNFSVAIKSDGTLWAWGLNAYGQLGDGTTVSKLVPTRIGTGTNWVSVAAGAYHTVALKADGTLWAWGYNGNGQLGDGTTTIKLVPTRIGSASNWVVVDAGASHTVAMQSDASIWAWGYNATGQLGDGTTTDKHVPTRIGASNTWIMIDAGAQHSAAVDSSGKLWTWGYNFYGQLGDGTNTDKLFPTQIGSDTWAQVSAGDWHTVARKANGTLWAWGLNSFGQLGDGTTIDRNVPTQIGSATNWGKANAGTTHTVALKDDGTLWVWGNNSNGQLGLGDIADRPFPAQVSTDTDWISADVGYYHTLGIKTGGALWTWGKNNDGQLGDGSTTDAWSPLQIW